MNPRRVAAIATKSLLQLRHDRRTMAFTVAMPLVMVVVFGYTFGGAVHDVRTLVVNADSGPVADLILRNMQGDTLALYERTDLEAARADVERGDAWAVIAFPANFSTDLLQGHGRIIVMLDGTSPVIVEGVLDTLQIAVEKTAKQVTNASLLDVHPDFVYGSKETRFIDFFAPGVMALAVLMVTTITSIVTVVRERADGMLERLFATPLQPSELVAGHAVSLAVLALAQTTVVLAAALLLFDVQVIGSLPLVFAVLLLFAIGNQGLGLMLSAGARNELQAVQMFPAILFPSLLLTGVFYPIESIPGVLQPLSYVWPLTYAIEALRAVMLRGWGLERILLDIAVLLLYDLLTLLGAAKLIGRQA